MPVKVVSLSCIKDLRKNKHLAHESGLGIHDAQVKPVWDEFESRVLALS